jgi:hypothetical protein
MAKEKKKKHYAQKLLPWIIVAVMLYTISAFVLQFFNGTEISPTLTTAYFAFWGTEIIAIATIKSVKEGKKNKETENSDLE